MSQFDGGPYGPSGHQPLHGSQPPVLDPRGGGGSGIGAMVAIGLLGGLVLVLLLGVIGFLLVERSNDDESTSTGEPALSTVAPATVPSTVPVATSTTTPPPSSAAPAPPTTADPEALPAGLLCRDLRAMGYSFPKTNQYWLLRANEQMDADGDGIPCETVYPMAEVVKLYPGATETYESNYSVLPSGLMCRDLLDRGFSVYDALWYYIDQGYPSNMDADKNGVPCETVYPSAFDVWVNEF